jgi:hypothetical protein
LAIDQSSVVLDASRIGQYAAPPGSERASARVYANITQGSIGIPEQGAGVGELYVADLRRDGVWEQRRIGKKLERAAVAASDSQSDGEPVRVAGRDAGTLFTAISTENKGYPVVVCVRLTGESHYTFRVKEETGMGK